VRIVIGLAMTVIALAIAGRRIWTLFRLSRTGQPVEKPPADATLPRWRPRSLLAGIKAQLTEVLGQRKLLKWSVPGVAHFLTFWGFIVLALTIIEAYGALFDRDFALPLIGHQAWLGFVEDLFAVAVLLAVVVFTVIRIRQAPQREHRASRFYGSHTGAAWMVLFMIFNVVWTLLLYRGAQIVTGHFPFADAGWWPFASRATAQLLKPLGTGVNDVLETVGILGQLGVIFAFLVIVAYSKHLHIGLAPLNVLFSRRPNALGPLLPMYSRGAPIDFESPGDEDIFGRGKVEDFTWKGMLDFATCTECGRCQSQCPAWNTGKPLSPKLVIMDLRDHLFAKAPYLLNGKKTDVSDVASGAAGQGAVEPAGMVPAAQRHGVPESGYGRVPQAGAAQAARPLVGTEAAGGVIDPDVLWSCTTCGACVEQCPVDIEHVDHIVDMRRYQVLIESSFPHELGGLFRNLETKGNPWGLAPSSRMDWARGLPFEVPVVDGRIPDDVEWLFWVGCAGAYDDRAQKTARAVAELLHLSGVTYAVLGEGETCTGDPARRAGNEFLFQMFAQQNVAALNEAGARKIVVFCPHCFNTLGNEYPQLGGHYEVVHHTQLLDRFVREGRLKPVTQVDGERTVTYHDPCYLGRHNKVYAPPRELIGALPGATLAEMPRNSERGFCCGAGGARMWMEEKIGKRVNIDRTEEAIATGAGTIAVSCPFCRVMISDGVAAVQSDRDSGDQVQVLDVAQLLLQSVERGQ
jgi:Fe-S oxidoreductase